MVSSSFRSFDATVLLDGLEPDREDVDATDAPYDDVTHHPVLAVIPCILAREGFGAGALRAREREEHDHEEERELDLPEDRHINRGQDREDEAQRHGAARFVRDVGLDAHAAHELLPMHDPEHRVGLVLELHLPA